MTTSSLKVYLSAMSFLLSYLIMKIKKYNRELPLCRKNFLRETFKDKGSQLDLI